MNNTQSFDDEQQEQTFIERVRLKKRGESLHFRILGGKFVIRHQHYVMVNGRQKVVDCPKGQAKSRDEAHDIYCQYCDEYYKIMQPVWEDKDSPALSLTKDQIAEINEKARQYKVQVKVFYPIIDKEDGNFKVFQTTNGVHLKIKEIFDQTKQLDPSLTAAKYFTQSQFIVTRIERMPNFYVVSRVDSSQCKPSTEHEDEEVANTMAMIGDHFENFDKLIFHKSRAQKPEDMMDKEDIPF